MIDTIFKFFGWKKMHFRIIDKIATIIHLLVSFYLDRVEKNKKTRFHVRDINRFYLSRILDGLTTRGKKEK